MTDGSNEGMDGHASDTPDCPSCYGTRHGGVRERYRIWRLYECSDCSVQYFWPRKNPGPEWYEQSEMYVRRDAMSADWMWYHEAGLAMLPARGGRLLDVGCGTGGFVAAARGRGYDAHGIDFSAKAIEAGARAFGIDTIGQMTPSEARARFGDNSFDVVTAFEVLEHMDDVGAFVRDLMALLGPGGRLIMSVPNRERRPRLLNEGDLPPHHFTRWNETSMRALLERHGLVSARSVVCPPHVTLKAFFLFYTRFGIVVRMLDRSGRVGDPRERELVRTRARHLALLKDRVAGAVAAVPAAVLGRSIRGPMLVASADRRG